MILFPVVKLTGLDVNLSDPKGSPPLPPSAEQEEIFFSATTLAHFFL